RAAHPANAAPTGQVFAVGAEGHATATALKGEQLLAGLRVPHLDCAGNPLAVFQSPGDTLGQALAVRAEGHAVDITVTTLKGEQLLAGLRVPHLELPGFAFVTSTPAGR